MMPPLPLVLWVLMVALSASAAVAWVVATSCALYRRPLLLRVAALGLAGAHAVSGAWALFVGAGVLDTHVATGVVHALTAGACATVGFGLTAACRLPTRAMRRVRAAAPV
jgi:hypothetical protein